ncbi:MAG: deoxyribonuclease IV [Patescibacteria group bacterium]|jgi:deoxyribonuclease-4
MLFGLHVSAAGGAQNAPKNAHDLKCEVFQFFSRSPQGGAAPKLTPEIVTAFKASNQEYDIPRTYIHTPYFINFASANPRLQKGSIEIVRGELDRASLLGVTAIMTHLGSAKDVPEKKALPMVATGLVAVLKGYTGTATFLLENSAGAGKVIGDTLEDLAFLIKKIPAGQRKHIGICIDTCHAFASGYDLRTKQDVDSFLKQFDKHIGLQFLKLFHANDSMAGLGEHKDRHEHIGKGKIGLAGFRALVQHPKLKNVDMLLETHHDGQHIVDLTTLKKLRNV